MPIEMYSMSLFFRISADGTKPRMTPPMSGRERMISNRKHAPTVTTSAMTSASMIRNPLFCSHSTSMTSSAVIPTPHASGIPNRRFSAIAAPMTSARSHAAMAISHRIHSMKLVARP